MLKQNSKRNISLRRIRSNAARRLLRVHNEGPLLFGNAREMHQSSSGRCADASGQSSASVTLLSKPVYIHLRLRNVSAKGSR